MAPVQLNIVCFRIVAGKNAGSRSNGKNSSSTFRESGLPGAVDDGWLDGVHAWAIKTYGGDRLISHPGRPGDRRADSASDGFRGETRRSFVFLTTGAVVTSNRSPPFIGADVEARCRG